MAKLPVAIVWFKRDLRIFDNQALSAACASHRVLPIYVIEDDYWRLPDVSLRHWRFIVAALADLAEQLELINLKLHILNGDVTNVLTELSKTLAIESIFSHEETGNQWTYHRDQRVAAYCKQAKINWRQHPQFGVIRGAYRREHWAQHWHDFMTNSCEPIPKRATGIELKLPPWQAPICQVEQPLSKLQRPTRAAGLHCLATFLNKRAKNFSGNISSPITATRACSRLSPYLSYGLLSIREVYQATCERLELLDQESSYSSKQLTKGLTSFLSRLHWHCHFIQKLEVDPSIEFDNMLSLADGLRPQAINDTKLQAWLWGQTGFPFVDACMRALRTDGWINFRMRAMLVSFASYQLWLNWRDFAPALARLFVDYEPGIHYAQIQMQAGTTGINAMRVYNPIKQSYDQDPNGSFIKQWLPELADVPEQYLHQPWDMPDDLQRAVNCRLGTDYPYPIVDNEVSMKAAKDKVYALRKHPDYDRLSQQVFIKHGSRKRKNKRRTRVSS